VQGVREQLSAHINHPQSWQTLSWPWKALHRNHWLCRL